MARKKKTGLVKLGSEIVTAGHAAKCVAKKFRGCSKAEILATVEVVSRMGKAAMRAKKK